MLAMLIWVPALATAILLILVGQTIGGILVAGLALMVHTMFRPHIAVYALIAAIPLEWLVSLLPGVATLTKLLGLFALLVTLPRLITATLPTHWDRSGRWMLLLILWALVSCFWAPVPMTGLRAWQSFALRWGIAVLICLQLPTAKRQRMGMLIFVGACALASLAFIASYDARTIASGSSRENLTNLVGQEVEESGSLNLQSRYTAVGVACALFLMLSGRRGLGRFLLLGAIPLLAIAVVLLKGRAVYLGLPFSLLAGVMFLRGAGVGRRTLLLTLIIVAGGLSALTVTRLGFFGEGIVERFASISETGLEAGGRLDKWRTHALAFAHSYGLGVGNNQMTTGLVEGSYMVAHNDWFSIAGELGLIGLTLFASFHFSLYLRIRGLQRAWPKAFCLVVWFLMLFTGLTEDDYVTKYYALGTGLVIAMLRAEESHAGIGVAAT